MNAKVKNDRAKYISRAALGGAAVSSPPPSKAEKARACERVSNGVIDNRWYIQLEPFKRGK